MANIYCEFTVYVSTFLSQIGCLITALAAYLSSVITSTPENKTGYRPLIHNDYSTLVVSYFYKKMSSFGKVVRGAPASVVKFEDKNPKINRVKCINLGSYNYLGFAENSGPCAEAAIRSIYQFGVSTGGTRLQYGTCDLHVELEKLIAEFLGTEDAIVFAMGYATNSLNLPLLLSPECLVISDEKNHASIIWGLRQAGARVEVFRHNDVDHLEQILRSAICTGQPKQPDGTHKPWRKLLIVVEGLYSMEATIVNLPEIIALKKKYKAYLYVDEAHSIGALGKRGGGVVDYFGCDPRDVDILMGTFTKTFSAAGGYIAGSKELIRSLRQSSFASRYGWAMPPVVASQITQVFKILMGRDGTHEAQKRLQALARNTQYFRRQCREMGLLVPGSDDSPIVPILVFHYSKLAASMEMLLREKIAMVGVGIPAVPQCRMRICLSAAHTIEHLDYVLAKIDKVAGIVGIKYCAQSKTHLSNKIKKIE